MIYYVSRPFRIVLHLSRSTGLPTHRFSPTAAVPGRCTAPLSLRHLDAHCRPGTSCLSHSPAMERRVRRPVLDVTVARQLQPSPARINLLHEGTLFSMMHIFNTNVVQWRLAEILGYFVGWSMNQTGLSNCISTCSQRTCFPFSYPSELTYPIVDKPGKSST